LAHDYLINGRFLAQPLTGVQRVAHGLMQALDDELAAGAPWQLLLPPGVPAPALRHLRPARTGPGWLRGHAWEQGVVGAAAARRGAVVLNIAGSGPWFGGPQVSWLHDAAVFDQPGGYTPAFVAWYRALFRRRVRRGDLLVVPSAHARDRLALHLQVPASHLWVLPHGGDHLDAIEPRHEVLQRLGLVPGTYWLCLASPSPNKNLARLVRAHARLGGVHGPLVLAGTANPRVFAAGGAVGADTAVRGLQAPSDGEVKALMLHARALVVPSLVEGFGLPALEAMRLGCPVVAARAGALPEVCGDAAEWVDPLDEADIARGLAATLDAVRCEHLRQAGRARAEPLTWRAAARRLLARLAEPAAGGAA
jgi:glycosyltransferase involved in cell wall biosynthesis